MPIRILLAAIALLVAVHVPARAAEAPSEPKLAIAAAANLTHVIGVLNTEFERSTPGAKVEVTFGASGGLFAQIRNGAPFDLFLSADTDYPAQLAAAGGADPASLRVFATGRLVLWTTRSDLELSDLAAALKNPVVKKFALAQPKSAPYGRAAEAVLKALGVAEAVGAKTVIGENITQTAQFVETGNADAGFVALSLVRAPRLQNVGRWVEVPPQLYRSASLGHAGVVTTRGTKNPLAGQYLAFLRSPAAQRILEAAGYRVPEAP